MEKRARIPVGPPSTRPLPSYWHEPKSPLANVIEPETENPAAPYDYAIIGSGISGAAIAYNLLYSSTSNAASPRIAMLEAREICGGATGRNGGHMKAASYRTYFHHRELYGKDEALRIARLEYANIVETNKLAKELGIECESQRCNTVDIIYDQATFEAGKNAIAQLEEDARDDEKELGRMAWYRIYEKGDAIKQKFWVSEKNRNPAVQGNARAEQEEVVGAFEYAAGQINAYRFTTGILKECVKKGLQLCANTPVHSLLPSDTHSDGSEHMYDIFTQYNTLQARKVIVATNGYTPYLLKSLQGAIVPLRGQITAQKPPKRAAHPSVLNRTYSFIYSSGYEYMISRNEPDGTQHIIIGGGLARLPEGGASEYGTVDDSRLNPQISKYLHGTLSGYFGAPNTDSKAEGEIEYEIVREWTGIMGATADGLPFVGEVPGNKGMWVSAGFNGHGMVLCLKSAEALVGMIRGGAEGEKVEEWFPKSFLISGERLEKCVFKGRTDMPVPETEGAPVESSGGCGISREF
ncbi:FAD dependent oxidoreductase-like protein [Byssothecium circinans]|uniref:FAD dependent oxidoreductase-like protein n=1 Tax=Byssothecium circinans TaxID=147558 RepID=A0A6A5TW90_9PLEO|nr:FAD dependent oxidoreductase-like protein [Byssothecium circinans]